jgi:hypothetical protein
MQLSASQIVRISGYCNAAGATVNGRWLSIVPANVS